MPDSFEHNGHAVTLTPAFLFLVEGPAFDGAAQTNFESAQQARDHIDQRVKALAAQNRHKAAVALEAIAADGSRCTIRGIHMNTRALLGVPKSKEKYASPLPVYPPELWIVADLAEERRLKNELATLQSRLRLYRMEGKIVGYGGLTAENYDSHLAAFVERWHKLCAAAAEHGKKVTQPA